MLEESALDDSAFELPCRAPRSIPGVTQARLRLLQSFFRAATRLNPRLAARLALALFTTPGPVWPLPSDRAVLNRARVFNLPFRSGHLRTYEWGKHVPAVVLVHGWSSCAARMSSLVDPLLRAGFRVVAFDAPGHGGSSGICASLELFQEALDRVTRAYGPTHGIVGHSFGARATLRLIAKRCRRNEVRALALVCMPPDVRYMFEQFKLVLELRPDVRCYLEREFINAFGALPEKHSHAEHASCVDVPVLLVHDREDDVAPVEHTTRLARHLPRCELLLTNSLNHSGPLRDPATAAAIAAFMQRC